MEEDLEHCSLDGDEDDEWSRPVEVLHSTLDHTQKQDRHKAERQQHSGSATPQSHPRTIVHIDIDCFYAQVEMIHNPALRDVPLGIQQKYLVVTCNYVARARGVTKLMGVIEAKKRCPELVLVCGEDLTRYREMSYKISEFLMKYTPCVERLGFDENFLDVTEMVDQRIRGGTAKTDVVGHVYYPQDCGDQSDSQQRVIDPCPCGCGHRLAVGSQVAADIRSALSVELDITCCAGMAHNKLLAKLVGSQHKPNQQTTVYPCHAVSLVTALHSARHIPGIGWATSKRLKAVGVETVSDLQRFPPGQLEEEFGVAMATTLSKLALGMDDSPVVTYSRPQMLSVEDSFRCCSSEQDAASRVSRLIGSLLPRVQEDGRTPRTLRLTVRKATKENRYLHRESRQCNLPSGIAAKITAGQLEVAQKHLVSMAMSLFHKMVEVRRSFHLTLINVAFARLEETASNDITTFFTSQSMATRSPGHHAASVAGSSCATPTPPYQQQLNSARDENVPDTVETTANPKRRHVGDLNSFFLKRPKMSDAANDSIEPQVRSVKKCDCSTDSQPSELSHDRSNVVLPAGVDPDVFVQLPTEIQQEILQTTARQTLPHRRLTAGSSVPLQNSKDSKQLAVPSTSEFIYTDRNPSSKPEQQTTDGSFLVQAKKAIFSPTKHKVKAPSAVHSVMGQEETLRSKTDDQTHLADLVIQEGEYVEQKDSTCSLTKEMDREFSSAKMGRLPQQSTQDWQMSPPDIQTFDTKFQSTLQKPQHSEACDAKRPSDSNGPQLSHAPKPSLIHSIHNPKMAVPKGVAPDVFCALPPEIRREVAAEMALQKHNVAPCSGNADSTGQVKSPAKQANSILNYLKRR